MSKGRREFPRLRTPKLWTIAQSERLVRCSITHPMAGQQAIRFGAHTRARSGEIFSGGLDVVKWMKLEHQLQATGLARAQNRGKRSR